jgi:hypothetical protein
MAAALTTGRAMRISNSLSIVSRARVGSGSGQYEMGQAAGPDDRGGQVPMFRLIGKLNIKSSSPGGGPSTLLSRLSGI